MNGYELSLQFSQLARDAHIETRELGKLVDEIEEARNEAEREREQAALALAAAYLPLLDPEALKQAEQRSGFRGFSRFDPIKAMDKERERLEKELVAMRAHESYVRREYLVGPVGSITLRLAEAHSLRDPWEQECKRFEDQPLFIELVETGYDTDHFTLRWWEPSYWRLWAAGDRICTALGLADFGDDVLPAYLKVRGPRDQWREQVRGIEAERDAVLELVRRHDSDTDRLAHLAEIYLDEAHKALAQHLRTADAGLLEQWAGEERSLLVQIRKLAGLGAKLSQLAELSRGIQQWSTELTARKEQYQAKERKYAYGKRAHRQYAAAGQMVKPRLTLDKSEQRRHKLQAQIAQLRRYDDYARFDLSQNAPELWWVEFTGKAPPVWSPGLRSWYQRNPQVSVHWDDHDHHDHSTAAAIGATLAEHRLDGLGDLS